ncbi:hypothetical protein D3C77_576150 [compost metagenome]
MGYCERQIDAAASCRTGRLDGDGWQCTGILDLERGERRDELHGEAFDDERRSVHERGDRSNDDELHEHRPDERHDVLLRR